MHHCVDGRPCLSSLYLPCKISQMLFFSFFLSEYFSSPMFNIQVEGFKEVQSELFGYLWVLLFKASKPLLYISIQMIFFMPAWGERTSTSQGWSDCSWSGLVSLQCPVLVSSPVFVRACAHRLEHGKPRAYVHSEGTLLTTPPKYKRNQKKNWIH